MFLKQFFIDGLGCESYLIADEVAKVATVIDPDRDVSQYVDAAAQHGFTITHIIETHLHADHVSGNTDLAQRTNAKIYIHEAAQAEFPHEILKDGDVLNIGALQIRVMHTPGHTPDSVTLLIIDPAKSKEPAAALTGDTLFAGDVGRPDLVGQSVAREMASQLYDSLFDSVLKLDDALTVYPGHGVGSLCGRSLSDARYTTIGAELATNPALRYTDREEFVHDLTTNVREQPRNHRTIKSMNHEGPKPLGKIEDRPLSIQQAIPNFERGAALLDVRPHDSYVAAHVPGGVHIIADDQLSSRIGLVLPPEVRIVILKDEDQDYPDIVLRLARVGYEDITGYLKGGIEEWESSGLPVTSVDVEDITPSQLYEMLQGDDSKPIVVDVRELWEYRMGRVPDAVLIPLGDLDDRAGELDPEQPVALICHSGVRSLSAAALLGSKGFKKMYNVAGGTEAWMQQGLPFEQE